MDRMQTLLLNKKIKNKQKIKFLFFVYFFVFCFYQNTCFAQNNIFAIVCDSFTKKPIPYVNVFVENSNIGTHSLENGSFSLICKNNDIIIFSCTGYKQEKKIAINLYDTIFLSEKIENLREIEISFKKKKIKEKIYKLGNFNSKKSGHFTNIKEAILYIENPIKLNVYIKDISFSISKIRFSANNRKPIKNQNILVKLHIYEKLSENNNEFTLLKENIVKTVKSNQKIIIFDLKEKNILLPKKGVFVGLEILGYFENNVFYPFDIKNTKITQQFVPNFSKGYQKQQSWFKNNYNQIWKPLQMKDEKGYYFNFNFGISVIFDE